MYLETVWNYAGKPRAEGLVQPSTHILTPETDHTTHYYWASGAGLSCPLSDEQHRAFLTEAFDIEDAPMIEAVDRAMGDNELFSLKPVLLPHDAGAVKVRRTLDALRLAERG
jgi:vanillate O-demethylase monooxygenase subunit